MGSNHKCVSMPSFHSPVFNIITVNPGSSDRLTAALTSPDSSYDGAQAITGYAVEARNENAL